MVWTEQAVPPTTRLWKALNEAAKIPVPSSYCEALRRGANQPDTDDCQTSCLILARRAGGGMGDGFHGEAASVDVRKFCAARDATIG